MKSSFKRGDIVKVEKYYAILLKKTTYKHSHVPHFEYWIVLKNNQKCALLYNSESNAWIETSIRREMKKFL